MSSNGRSLEEYRTLLGRTVKYTDGSVIKRGQLVDLTYSHGTNEMRAEILTKVPAYLGFVERTSRDYVPISNIYESNFTHEQARKGNSDSNLPQHENFSVLNTFSYGNEVYYATGHNKFKLGDHVIWMLPNNLWSTDDPYIGHIEFIGIPHHAAVPKEQFYALVTFNQPTNYLAGYVTILPAHRNLINVDDLLLYDEWRQTCYTTPPPRATTSSPPNIQRVSFPRSISTSDDQHHQKLPIEEIRQPVHEKLKPKQEIQFAPQPRPRSKLPVQSEEWMQKIDIQHFCQSTIHSDNGGGHGIQGQGNSSYMDATIFSLFAFTNAFDSFIVRDKLTDGEGVKHQLKKILRRDAIESLRKEFYVPCANMNKIQRILASNGKPDYNHADMDVEEFMMDFFEFLEAPPLFSYDDGEPDFIHQIVLPDNWNESRKVPYMSVQRLLEDSFMTSEVKLADIPERAFILKLPVSDGKLLPCNGVIPSLTIDLSPILNGPRGRQSAEMHLHAVICLRNKLFCTFVRPHPQDDEFRWVFMNSNPSTSTPKMQVIRGISEITGKAMVDVKGFSGMDPQCDGIKLFRDAYICVYVP